MSPRAALAVSGRRSRRGSAALPGPPFELATAFQRGDRRGERVAAVEIGKTRDLTDPLDLVEENFPYLGT